MHYSSDPESRYLQAWTSTEIYIHLFRAVLASRSLKLITAYMGK